MIPEQELESLKKRVEELEARPKKAPPVVTMASLLNLLICLVNALAEACTTRHRRQ